MALLLGTIIWCALSKPNDTTCIALKYVAYTYDAIQINGIKRMMSCRLFGDLTLEARCLPAKVYGVIIEIIFVKISMPIQPAHNFRYIKYPRNDKVI